MIFSHSKWKLDFWYQVPELTKIHLYLTASMSNNKPCLINIPMLLKKSARTLTTTRDNLINVSVWAWWKHTRWQKQHRNNSFLPSALQKCQILPSGKLEGSFYLYKVKAGASLGASFILITGNSACQEFRARPAATRQTLTYGTPEEI